MRRLPRDIAVEMAYEVGFAVLSEMAWEHVGMSLDEFHQKFPDMVNEALAKHPLESAMREILEINVNPDVTEAFHEGVLDSWSYLMRDHQHWKSGKILKRYFD